MRKCIAIAVLVLAGALLAVCWPNMRMVSHNLGCATSPRGREGDICKALSDSMEWTWFGHAIVSPGWRFTWNGLRLVYCREKIGAADLRALEHLRLSPDWRLQDAAADLIRLLSPAGEPENSIFNPNNSGYVLRGGCGDNT
jgi:hypothetical protein